MFWIKRIVTVGKLHICIGRNDSIQDRINEGIQKKRSFHFTHVPGHIFIAFRIGPRFIDIDWI